jgi:hypothetical protein
MHRIPPCLRAVPAILVAILGGTGCVTVYQPLTALQAPTAIVRATDNFEGQRILLQCVPSEDFKPSEGRVAAQEMCTKLNALFSGQGAQVETTIPGAGSVSLGQPVATARPDLVIQVRSRELHRANPALMWALCIASCSVVPAYREATHAIDVSIRDAEGFELVSESYQARFVEYVGGGVWLVNRTLDATVREEDEQVIGKAQRDFSRDLYQQLTQLAFNARVRSSVLRSFEPTSAPPKKAVN